MAEPHPDGLDPGLINRKPQRISITVPWALYSSMRVASKAEGRSLSNIAAHWLECHHQARNNQAE